MINFSQTSLSQETEKITQYVMQGLKFATGMIIQGNKMDEILMTTKAQKQVGIGV